MDTGGGSGGRGEVCGMTVPGMCGRVLPVQHLAKTASFREVVMKQGLSEIPMRSFSQRGDYR